MKIKLAEDTITFEELKDLSSWILTNQKLTKDVQTSSFESEFSKLLNVKHSIFTNSGSSSNLLMISALQEGNYLKNKIAIAAGVSWVTTVSPLIQLGYDVKLCDCDKDNLGIDVNHLDFLCKKYKPSLLIIVHVLGHSNSIKEIQEICNKYDVILLEDACEALGSKYENINLGTFGAAGSFSFYYGHHISTIEGGMVTTNDSDLYKIMLSIRSHGWSRDMKKIEIEDFRRKYDIDEFRNFYTFYYPGFNLRSTDLQAFIGRSQLKKVDKISKIREENFFKYKELLNDFFVQKSNTHPISSFAFGTLIKNRIDVYKKLKKNGIETRPLICGNIGRQPFWLNKFKNPKLKNADIIHDYGIYLPNHQNIDASKIKYIADNFKSIAEPYFY